MTRSFDAGDGLFVSLAGTWTPHWTNRYGLGAYASAGIKYVRVADEYSSASFTRYPVAAAAELRLPVSERWLLLGRAGLLTEVGGKLVGERHGAGMNVAFTASDFAIRPGGFIDAGVYRSIRGQAGIAVLVRYTHLDLSFGGRTDSANNLSAGLGLYFTR